MANGTCEGGPLCSADTVREVQKRLTHLHSFVIPEETKCSESKVRAESPTERLFLRIECKKKEEERREWPLESSTSCKLVLCNNVKPGRAYSGERRRTREAKTSPDKEPESSCFVGFLQILT